MSQTKAQLIQPIGVVTAAGVVVSGVMTAATFDGSLVGSATSIIQGTNLNLGAFNASSFAGDFTGNATGIITSSAIKVGQLTASSFVGDFTGTATSMAKGTGFEAGTVTSTAANVTYTVTVSGGDFYLDSLQQPTPTLYPGATYTFDQSDSTNGTHPLRFATAADAAGSTEYTDGVTTNGTPGSAGAWTKIVVPRNAPTPLYYYCSNHSGMGASINITNQLQGAVTGDVTGSATGIAGTVVQGTNIHVGVITATSLYGDGSNLTGIAATNYNTQTVTIGSTSTSIDLSAGNMITVNQNTSSTVSFANTSEAMDVTFIRPGGGGSYNISLSTGGVDFDGTDDDLATTLTTAPGTSDFTLEYWVKQDTLSDWQTHFATTRGDGFNVGTDASGDFVFFTSLGGGRTIEKVGAITTGVWYHWAFARTGGTTTGYLNGVAQASFSDTYDYSPTSAKIGNLVSGSEYTNGVISNLRLVVGTALYTGNFVPPTAALTNVDNTKLLCCQSTSDATAKAVGGTITASSSPTAGAQTITASGTYPTQGNITWPSGVKWNGGSAPTLLTSDKTGAGQQFQLLTRDSGVTWYGWESYSNEATNWSLFGWGWNQSGGLGINSRTATSSPTQIPGTTWTQLSTSVAGSCNATLKSDGTLWVWGNSANGRLGLNQGPGNNRSSPCQLPGTTWKSVAAGSNFQLATKSDNTLWSWGNAGAGVLGQNSINASKSSPTQVGTDTTWASGKYKLSAGSVSCGVIKTNGTLWSWGYNEGGTLGHNNKTEYSSPKQVGTDTTWRSIGGQYYGGVMIGTKSDLTLWAWGWNGEGGLGLNDTNRRSSPTQIPGTTWSELTPYGGWQGVSVIKTDGTLWIWGNNDNGAAGQNSTNNGYSSPTQVPGTTWKECGMGDNGAVVALKTDGTIWSWGLNQQGNLGQNQADGAKYSSPTQIGSGTAWHSIQINNIESFALKSN